MTRVRPSFAVLLLVACTAAAWAEEPPPAVRALDTADAAAREEAERALDALPDRDATVAAVLRDAEGFGALGVPGRTALVRLAATVDVAYVNGALRRIVRDDAEDDAVRRAAVSSLGKRGGIADVGALRGALERFPAAAARALAEIGGRSAEGALRAYAEKDAHPAVLAALVRMGDDGPLSTLTAALRTEDAGRRARIGRLLVWATGRELPPSPDAWDRYVRRSHLARALADEDLDAAQNAVGELAGVLRSHTSATLEGDLVAILGDAAWGPVARDGAALVLGLGGARGAQPALLAATRNQEEGSVRLYAAEALARVGDLSVAMPLADMLVHDEDRDRIKARRSSTGEFYPVDPALARALLRLGCPGAVEPLLEVLAGDYRTRMHRDTLRCLREVTPSGDDFGFEPDSAAEDRDAAVARARAWWSEAREGLGIAPRPDDPGWDAFRADVAAHVETLGAFKFLHQLRAKKALVIVAEPALPQLEEALSADDLHVRMGAAEVLQIAGLRAAGPALARRLDIEENPAARTKLLAALERCGRTDEQGRVPGGVREAVRARLHDGDLEVRIAAAHALGVVGDREGDPDALRGALESGDSDVPALRAAIAGSLLLLGDSSAFDDLATELQSGDALRRADAAALLQRAGIDLSGYDPDAPPTDRAAAIERIRSVLEETR